MFYNIVKCAYLMVFAIVYVDVGGKTLEHLNACK